MPTFTITSTSIIRISTKCISFNSFRFHIVVYHSGKHLAIRISLSLSSIKPTTQIESQLPEPISSSAAAAPDNSLNTSASSLSVETCPLQSLINLPHFNHQFPY
ncbi:hypothetical protein TNCV_2807481 [Trichonephila clavipes]|nr:hypothetical protein TNCV_2807481 [Trichonephila clavipes]